MSWFGHRGCLAGHQTTWVDLPCCYWLNLKLQVDFTSLAIHTKLYILGTENTVLKYGGSQGIGIAGLVVWYLASGAQGPRISILDWATLG